MSLLRRTTTPLLGAVACASAVLAGPALAAGAGPEISAHAIFAGGAAVHAGAVAQLDVEGHKSAPKLMQLCMTPAPIDRPSCAASAEFAPAQAGTTTLTASFADGSTSTATIAVHGPGTKLGGLVAVRGRITCAKTTFYGNWDPRKHVFRDPMSTATGGTRVALYNRIGKGRFAQVYANGTRGFVTSSCLMRAAA